MGLNYDTQQLLFKDQTTVLNIVGGFSMTKLLRMLGFLWAAPLTLLALPYVLLFSALGWYTYLGMRGDALTWFVNLDKLPKLCQNFWSKWGGHCIGNVVVVKWNVESDRGRVTLRHEQEHVRQCMVLGIFQPIIYAIAWIGLYFCRYSDPYYSNPFEIDARRAAGQIVDIEGTIKRFQEQRQDKTSS